MLTKKTTFVFFTYLCRRFNRGIFPTCLNIIVMYPNKFITVTCVLPHRRSSFRVRAGFNQCHKTANDILSKIVRASCELYHEYPFITTQVVSRGSLDVYSHFVSYPRRSGIRYVIRYEIINDLPF